MITFILFPLHWTKSDDNKIYSVFCLHFYFTCNGTLCIDLSLYYMYTEHNRKSSMKMTLSILNTHYNIEFCDSFRFGRSTDPVSHPLVADHIKSRMKLHVDIIILWFVDHHLYLFFAFQLIMKTIGAIVV